MKVNEIRSAFLNFFKSKGHHIVPSSPLVPNNDPSLMFTNAGMVQFKNYFTGVEVPNFKTAVSSQKCVRAGGKHNDLENVGYTARHHTFFEMLGNFSFGDYFKEDAIAYAWEFLTKVLGLAKEKLYVTVYHDDDEAFHIWQRVTGFPDEKIIRIATNDNFWSMGETGPCGPCTEIFYDHGPEIAGGLPGTPEEDGDRYIEIWNIVFMQYERLADGSMVDLPKPCVDTGMGLERIAAVLQKKHNNYECDLFTSIISKSMEISGNKHEVTSHRVIADHLRSTAFLIADGVMPSNEGRGYVLRRIMRRAMRHIHHLGVKSTMLHLLVPTLIEQMSDAFPELKRAQAVIESTIRFEEEKFRETLDKGMRLLDASIQELNPGDELGGDVAFKLYDTYGFPLDLTRDILRGQQISLDEKGFDKHMAEQKQRARAAWKGSGDEQVEELWFEVHEKTGATEFLGYAASEAQASVQAIIQDGKILSECDGGTAIVVVNQTPFYAESGGQVGDTGFIGLHRVVDTKKFHGDVFGHYVELHGEIKVGETLHLKIDVEKRNQIRANHSATHLLHKILRDVLGEHVTQKGSIVTADKLRFDFAHNKAMSHEEITMVEELVNRMIIANHCADTDLMPPEHAIEKGAMALFGEKYGEEVRVVAIGNSMELCGGTHVASSGDIGVFKIVSEEAVASGVRRIEALTGLTALKYINKRMHIVNDLLAEFKCSEADLPARLHDLVESRKNLQKELSGVRIANAVGKAHADRWGSIPVVIAKLDDMQAKDLKEVAAKLMDKYPGSVVVIAATEDGKASLLVQVDKSLTARVKAGDLIKESAPCIDGRGGGKPEMAQAGGTNVSGIEQALDKIKACIAGA
jgi:alanyl-tRNA synthetase